MKLENSFKTLKEKQKCVFKKKKILSMFVKDVKIVIMLSLFAERTSIFIYLDQVHRLYINISCSHSLWSADSDVKLLIHRGTTNVR